jgi:UDP-N-acetylglucosamine--N-acetylmuramyl-(pentapeptide) pyrophosphoryl-undecaprenol N-acetylglucosamine transferase
MTIVVTGGGSGGHITPILAVASELKKLQPDVRIVYIGQRGDRLGDIPADNPSIDAAYAVRAGKFRRYHGEGLKQLLDLPTLYKNIRDGFYVLAGIWQSFWLLGRLHPEVIFVKGGFVGVPVGLAAAVRHIPFITHDSDAIPGLANRIIAHWAATHAVALPKEAYAYPAHKTVTVGVPVQGGFVPVSSALQAQYRRELGLDSDKILFVTGGGNGAQRLNEAVAGVLPELLEEFHDLAVVQAVGRQHEAQVKKLNEAKLTTEQQGRVIVKGYIEDLYRYSGAADVIIMRAGATNLAEFAIQGKACLVVPNPQLTGAHQTKNAQYLAKQHAVEVVEEAQLKQDPTILKQRIKDLLTNERKQIELATSIAKLAHISAAHDLAVLLLEQAATREKQK